MLLPPPEELESPRRTRIKICGISSVETAMMAVEAGADAIGLVHVRDSLRYVSTEKAREIALQLPLTVQAVSVFRDHSLEEIAANHSEVVQLHGDESSDFCERLRAAISNAFIIKALAFDADAVKRWDACDAVDALLIEGSSPGTGTAFSYDDLIALMPTLRKPVILAGGLTPENVSEAIARVKPYGVDVSSGVEQPRSVKNANLIRSFCQAAHNADIPPLAA